MEGVDYSSDHPDPVQLAAAGKRFAVRYVGTPTLSKSLDAVEAQALRAAGVDLVAVYQTSKGFMATAADGARAAQRARDHARACGMPDGRPIYFALDVPPGSLTTLQWLAVNRFLVDAGSVLGRNAVGVYGGLEAIERLVPSVARFGWQTYAWSGGDWSDQAQLQQYRNSVRLAGGLVDLCRSTTPDYGQWGLTQEDDDVTEDQLKDALRAVLSEGTPKGQPTWARGNRAMFAMIQAVYGQRDVDLDVDEAELAAELLPGLIEVLDIPSLVAAIPKAVRAELAAALAVEAG